MNLYTESHITAVFLMGILNGVIGAFVVQEYKSCYRVTRLLFKMMLRPMAKHLKRIAKSKRKVPTARTVSTFNH